MSGWHGCGAADHHATWDAVWNSILTLTPWFLLAASVGVNQAFVPQDWGQRGVTLAVVAAAACWVYVGHTRRSALQRERTVPGVVYFVGLLAFAATLLQLDLTFVMFAITGFFHAFQLRPVSLGVAGVFATSLLINTTTMTPFAFDAEAIAIYVGIVLIQTTAISAGLVFGAKGAEMDRRRQAMLVRLEEALEENAGLHAQLLTQAREAGVLDERQRMAREIHDTLAQGLTGIITQVQAAQRVWHNPPEARQHVDRALGLAKDGLAEARRSVEALRPQDLAEAQLPDALDTLVRRWSEESGVHATIDVTGERAALSPAIEVALYRMAQEALTNVAKHAAASRAGVTLSYLDDVVLLDVRDDGIGMGPDRDRGFGITSMTQRIRSVGGRVALESAPGEGTAVSAEVPSIAAGSLTRGAPAPGSGEPSAEALLAADAPGGGR